MYKKLVFGDEFLVQGLHLKSHQSFTDNTDRIWSEMSVEL